MANKLLPVDERLSSVGNGTGNPLKNFLLSHIPGKLHEMMKPNLPVDSLADTQVQGHLARPATRFSLPSGSRPLSGYTIKRGVGTGGFGEVYYATSDAGKDVALKKVLRHLDIELRGVRQCLNLKHPNLLALYDIRQDDEGEAWIVMEYIAGESLQQVLQRYPEGMPLDQVQRWWDGLSAGVAHLHDCGIVHRDLKPGNVFLDEGMVKIGDYGLSKFISCSQRSGQTQSVGTFHYMAPEIGRGRYGKEIDIYALGIILFEMLTGKVPYDGESSQEIIMKHLTANPPVSGLMSPYREVIERALAKDPEQRFQTVHQMQAMLSDPAGRGGMASQIAASDPNGRFSTRGAHRPVVSEEAAPPVSQITDTWRDEPLARAARAAWNEISQSWHSIGSGWRIALLSIAAVLVLMNSRWLVPYVGAIAVYYGVYVAVRAMLATSKSSPAVSGKTAHLTAEALNPLSNPESATASSNRRSRKLARKLADQRIREQLTQRPAKERATEYIGSLLLSAVICGVSSLAGCIWIAQVAEAHFFQMVPISVWLTVISTLVAWGTLTLSRWLPLQNEDRVLRRFLMLTLGFGIGAVGFGLADWLSFTSPQLLALGEVTARPLFFSAGQPTAVAYLAYFGAFFAIFNGWKLADPLRKQRFSFWGTGYTTLTAIILQYCFPVFQGFLVALIGALAIQLAAPWIAMDQRRGTREGFDERASFT